MCLVQNVLNKNPIVWTEINEKLYKIVQTDKNILNKTQYNGKELQYLLQ